MATTTSARGSGVGDFHKSDQSLLSFVGFEISRHLHHVDSKREEAMEGVIVLLYNRVDGGVSRKI